MTRYPKLLPWMAKKFDLPVELAQKLWRIALGEAIEMCQKTEGAEVSRLAIERFVDLLEAETGKAVAPVCTDSTWYWRHQRRMATLTFSATNASCIWWNDLWARSQKSRMTC